MSSMVKTMWTIDQSVQHQPVLRQIDGWHAAVMAFVEQAFTRSSDLEKLGVARLDLLALGQHRGGIRLQ